MAEVLSFNQNEQYMSSFQQPMVANIQQMNNVNPLLQFARGVETSVKLPSNYQFYPDGFITYNNIGEVDIFPMRGADEIQLLNSEALVSGTAIVNLIKSCVPGIADPNEMFYNDMNVVLLGIRKATYGDKLTQKVYCPNCYKKIDEIKAEELQKLMDENGNASDDAVKKAKENADKRIAKLEKEGKLMSHSFEWDLSIDQILSTMTFVPSDNIYVDKNGLEYYLIPNKVKDRIKYLNLAIQTNRIQRYADEHRFTGEELMDEEKLQLATEIYDLFTGFSNIGNELVASSIVYIKLPDGTIVSDHNMITEYISQTKSLIVGEIQKKIETLNKAGIIDKFEATCSCCGHKWEETLEGFNQLSFFTEGS